MIPKVKALWHSLPPKAQATIVILASTAGTFLGQTASQYFLEPSAACWQWHCLRHTLSAAILAGLVAAKAFYMRPGPGPQAQLQK
ncbi:MAG: hypothetical protein WBF25_00015 [Terriglobales bacterium]